ncbi:hypothetical protein TREES_T100003270 [Tupaia chinensis]|uniref:Uncharacterized protein n=1 Tax=Tupaia chinensis TaxID=246437 RepID=L9JG58_TUPCH|nr:hypothetical protein TREES_T100003270 [Tupaia chinensis]
MLGALTALEELEPSEARGGAVTRWTQRKTAQPLSSGPQDLVREADAEGIVKGGGGDKKKQIGALARDSTETPKYFSAVKETKSRRWRQPCRLGQEHELEDQQGTGRAEQQVPTAKPQPPATRCIHGMKARSSGATYRSMWGHLQKVCLGFQAKVKVILFSASPASDSHCRWGYKGPDIPTPLMGAIGSKCPGAARDALIDPPTCSYGLLLH